MSDLSLRLPLTFSIDLARDAGTIDLDVDRLSPEVLLLALQHGLKQKFGDGANSEAALAKMVGATVQDKVNSKAAILRDQLYRGIWALKSGGGGPKLDEKGKFIRAEALKAARVYIASGKFIVNGKPMMKIADSDAVKAVSEKYLSNTAWLERVGARFVPTLPDSDIDPFADDC